MTINDMLFGLEMDLAGCSGTTPADQHERRRLLRKAMRSLESAAYQEGYSDCSRDVSEARVIADRAQEAAEKRRAEDG